MGRQARSITRVAILVLLSAMLSGACLSGIADASLYVGLCGSIDSSGRVTDTGCVRTFNTDTNAVETTITGFTCTSGIMALSPDGSTLYVADQGEIKVIDTVSNTIVNVIPRSGDYMPNKMVAAGDGLLYIVDGDSYVDVIDTRTHNIQDRYVPGFDIAVSPDNSRLYAAQIDGSGAFVALTVYDAHTRDKLKSTTVRNSISAIALNPEGDTLYVTTYADSGNFLALRTSDLSTIRTVSLQSNPGRIVVKPDGSKVYVLNYDFDTIAVVSGDASSVEATLATRARPCYAAVAPDGKKVYVYCTNGITIFNTEDNTVGGFDEANAATYGGGIALTSTTYYYGGLLGPIVISTPTPTPDPLFGGGLIAPLEIITPTPLSTPTPTAVPTHAPVSTPVPATGSAGSGNSIPTPSPATTAAAGEVSSAPSPSPVPGSPGNPSISATDTPGNPTPASAVGQAAISPILYALTGGVAMAIIFFLLAGVYLLLNRK